MARKTAAAAALIAAYALTAEALPGRAPYLKAKDASQATGRIIVQVDRHYTSDGRNDEVAYRAAIDRLLKDTGLAATENVRPMYAFGMVAMSNSNSHVVSKVLDHHAVALAADSTKARALGPLTRTVARELWGLDRLDSRQRTYNGTIALNGDGEGVDVFVLDTGVKIEHEQFEGRAHNYYTAFADATGRPAFDDKQGHGTHCAGTVAGRDTGVAPKAAIYNVRVLGDSGYGDTEGIFLGMLSVLDRPDPSRPAVVSMSLGGIRDSDMYNYAVDVLVDNNVVVVVAAGNDNQDACRYAPAHAAGAITVGAADKDDKIATFSNWGTCVDIFAPGVDIYSSSIHHEAYETMSGTSMACPHVAGVVATLRSQYPGLTVPQVKEVLYGAATPHAIKGIPTCPQTPNLNTYARFDSSMFVARDRKNNHRCRDAATIGSSQWSDTCTIAVTSKCRSISPLTTDEWCENVQCNDDYATVCGF